MSKNKKIKKSLTSLAQTRTGGEINIRGLNFQYGNEFEESEFGNPHSIILTETLTEYQEKLDENNIFEKKWLSNIENNYKTKINHNLLKIKDDTKFIDVEKFILKLFSKDEIYSKLDIVNFMNKLVEDNK